MDIAGKHFGILGAAREGIALAHFLAARGGHITITDNVGEAEIRARLHPAASNTIDAVAVTSFWNTAQPITALFVSPGVPPTHDIYATAVRLNVPIESMTTLFFAACPGRIVGVTGSSGKTTTTGLIGHILQTEGIDSVIGGNIGAPMIDLLPSVSPGTVVVLELSSFQLEILRQSPNIAVVTNITPNHLDRHGSMADYLAAKRSIVAYQSESDFAVLNTADPHREYFAGATPAHTCWFGPDSPIGACVRHNTVGLVHGDEFTPVMPVTDIPLLGTHNVENVLAALAATAILEVSIECMARAISTFVPAAHRLQPVADVNGVRFVDDSIATTPARAKVALEAVRPPVLLLAGGRDKRLPWDEFAETVVERVRVLFVLGEAAGQIADAVRTAARDSERTPEIVQCSTLHDAVFEAAYRAVPGDTVLLSPACTSYDMFANYEERGEEFVRAVRALNAA